MTLHRRASKKMRGFDLPVSYRVNESRERLRDALNVFSNQGRLESRYGRSLFNAASLGGTIQSMSFFKNATGTKSLIVKCGTSLYSIDSSGVPTVIKTGLSETSKHRGKTWARGTSSRHIILTESDGQFQWNGTSFTSLGQAKPAQPIAAASATLGTLTSGTYRVYLTYYSSSTGFESNASDPVTVSVAATRTIQSLIYTARESSASGDLISIAYTTGATAGAEVVTVAGNAITVQIATGVSTALQIKSAIERKTDASVLVSVAVSGLGTTAQTGPVSATFLTGGVQSIALSSIPTTATNSTIDKVNVYITSTVDDPVFVVALSLGVSSYTITSDPESTVTFPVSNAAPLSGGGKYFTEFNRKLVYTGNANFPNDVFFSEEDLPDAFNDGSGPGRLVLSVSGDGETTGIATGLYNNSVLDPYLVIFKKRSTHVYSEIGGEGKFIPIHSAIGCVSHETIQVKNGDVYFLSDNGWRVISNGRVMTDENNNTVTLGMGDVDDIFRTTGYTREVNRSQLVNSFSVYYSTLDQYLTWVPEGSNVYPDKTYCYEFSIGGFKPFQFLGPSTAACIGEDSAGDEVVFMADVTGSIYTYSIKEPRSDEDSTGTQNKFDSYAMMTWLDGDDLSTSYNFRDLILRRVSTDNEIIVKAWINFDLSNLEEYAFSFPMVGDGAIWDESNWDQDVWGDERAINQANMDINRVGFNILIGFYQSTINGNIGLVACQLDMSKNGNAN